MDLLTTAVVAEAVEEATVDREEISTATKTTTTAVGRVTTTPTSAATMERAVGTTLITMVQAAELRVVTVTTDRITSNTTSHKATVAGMGMEGTAVAGAVSKLLLTAVLALVVEAMADTAAMLQLRLHTTLTLATVAPAMEGTGATPPPHQKGTIGMQPTLAQIRTLMLAVPVSLRRTRLMLAFQA